MKSTPSENYRDFIPTRELLAGDTRRNQETLETEAREDLRKILVENPHLGAPLKRKR